MLADDLEVKAVRELIDQPDRAAALVGLAIVEKKVTSTLRWHLPNTGETVKELFRVPSGKLADYDAKIKLAYAMGLLSKLAFTDLAAMGEIRNRFAHRLEINSFEHPEIAARCSSLGLIDRHVFQLGGPEIETTPERTSVSYVEDFDAKKTIPRQRFYLTAMFVTSQLAVRTPHESTPRPPVRPPLL